MKLRIVYILLSFCFYSCYTFSQYTMKAKDLPMLSISDTNLCSILDSVIAFEKNCDYYNDSLFFTVKLKQIKKDSLYTLNIQSNNNMRTAINLDPYGYLYYKEHLFVIYGFNKNIFSETNRKRKFKYEEHTSSLKKGEVVTVINILNDSFTIWNYWYVKGNFIFRDRSSSCD